MTFARRSTTGNLRAPRDSAADVDEDEGHGGHLGDAHEIDGVIVHVGHEEAPVAQERGEGVVGEHLGRAEFLVQEGDEEVPHLEREVGLEHLHRGWGDGVQALLGGGEVVHLVEPSDDAVVRAHEKLRGEGGETDQPGAR